MNSILLCLFILLVTISHVITINLLILLGGKFSFPAIALYANALNQHYLPQGRSLFLKEYALPFYISTLFLPALRVSLQAKPSIGNNRHRRTHSSLSRIGCALGRTFFAFGRRACALCRTLLYHGRKLRALGREVCAYGRKECVHGRKVLHHGLSLSALDREAAAFFLNCCFLFVKPLFINAMQMYFSLSIVHC